MEKEININLFDSFESELHSDDESINQFIQYFKEQEIELNNSNIFLIKSLSEKYEISKLKKKADEYINNNYQNLINNFLSLNDQISQQPSSFYELEKLFSFHISEYLTDDRLLSLPINVLYRIFCKYYQKKTNKSESRKCITKNTQKLSKKKLNKQKKKKRIKILTIRDDDDDDDDDENNNNNNNDNNIDNDDTEKFNENQQIIDFLIKTFERKGEQALILINAIHIDNDSFEYFLKKLDELNENIKINFLSSKIIHYLTFKIKEIRENEENNKNEHQQMNDEIMDMKNEIKKMKEEYSKIIENMKIEFEKQETYFKNEIMQQKEEMNDEIIKLKDEIKQNNDYYENKIEEIQIKNGKEKEKLKDEIKQNSDYYENKIEEIQIKNGKEKEKLNHIILFSINGVLNKQNNNICKIYELLSYISCANIQSNQQINVYKSIFIPNETSDFEDIILRLNQEEQLNIGIHSNALDMLYLHHSLKSEFYKQFYNFSKITFELRSSSRNFESILENISYIKNQISDLNDKINIEVVFDQQKIKEISENNDLINSIKIKSPISTINESIFKNFISLSTVEIDSTITKICNESFNNCLSLSTIKIPPTVKSIGKRCFSGCWGLKEITIPFTTEISDSVFENCSSLSIISIPNTITKIGNKAFKGCSSLSNITIPSSVKSIGKECFFNCTSLKEIILPTSITKICKSTFEGCESLDDVILPSSLNSIEKMSFSKCSSLTHIFIPSSVEEIGENAFEECDTLKLISVSKPFLKDKIGIHKTAKIIYNDNELDFIYEFAQILKKEGNKKEAFYFFKLAADKGHVDSMFQYGSMNYSGDYIPVNKKEAFKYFQLAADNGHAMAMHYIGYMYSHGESVEVDINKAAIYYKTAADNGVCQAMYNYGHILCKNDEDPTNNDEGIKYLKLAAEKGYKKAEQFLKKLDIDVNND